MRFIGRPQDYSPKARLLNLLGYKLPFDRHDWVVDRCGREARRCLLSCLLFQQNLRPRARVGAIRHRLLQRGA